MPSKFSNHIRSFIGSSLIKSLRYKSIPVWSSGVSVTIGTVIQSNNSKYVANSSGNTGTFAPSHTNGVQSDGAISWTYVEPIMGESSINNMYLFIGKTTPWDDENAPPNPDLSDLGEYTIHDNIITLKQVSSGDMVLGIVRHNWEHGVVYSKYDSNIDPFDTDGMTPFYVITDEYNIYKCIDNKNGSVSTNKPTGTSISNIALGDGYVWKYMGSVSVELASLYLTDTHVPVEYKNYNDGSNQWNVQSAATQSGISSFEILTQRGDFTGTPRVTVQGAGTQASTLVIVDSNSDSISQITVNSPGRNYTQETYAIVDTNGSGTGATASVVIGIGVNAGKIMSLNVVNPGTGYVAGQVTVLITGTSSDGSLNVSATATATVGANTSISEFTVTNQGSGYTSARAWIIAGSAGCVAKAIMAPINGHGSNIINELGASTVIIASTLIRGNPHLLSGVDSDFRQVGLISSVKDHDGSVANETFYIGPSHPNYMNPGTLKRMKQKSGYPLYLSNITSVSRSSEQEEHIKIAIVF